MNMQFILNDPPYGRERCDTEARGLDEAETMDGGRAVEHDGRACRRWPSTRCYVPTVTGLTGCAGRPTIQVVY